MRKVIFLLFGLSGLVACSTAASSTYENDVNQASKNYESERDLDSFIYEDEDFEENDYLPTIGEDNLDVHDIDLEADTDEDMQNVDRYESEEEDNEPNNDDFEDDLQDLQPIVRMVRGSDTPKKTTPGGEPSLPHRVYRSSASEPQKKKTRRHPTRKPGGKKMKSMPKRKSGKKKKKAKKRMGPKKRRTHKKVKKRMEKKHRGRKKAKKASKKRSHIEKRRRSPKVKVKKRGRKTRPRGRSGRGRRPTRPRRPPYYVKPTRPATKTSTKPRTTQPRTTQPRTTQPRTTQPRTTQPRTTQPRTTQPRTTQPRTTQPRTTQPRTTKPISTGYVGGQSGNYPAQCKCRETPRKNGICYDMYTTRKIGRCKRRSCSASFECVPGGGPRLKDCIRRVAKFEVKVIRSRRGKHRCRRVKLRRPKVFYTLYH